MTLIRFWKPFVPILLAICIYPAPAASVDNPFSLGFVLGDPTGVSGKYWIGYRTAIQGAAAWSFRGPDAFQVHGDFLIHLNKTEELTREVRDIEGTFLVYYGIGGRIKIEPENRLGVRFPLGLNYFLKDSRLSFFVEIAPLLDLAPATEFDMNGGLGLRFSF